MSFFRFELNFLTMRPRISTEGGLLIIRNSGLSSFLSVGLYARSVTIDKAGNTIHFASRYFYGFKKEHTILITQLGYLEYEFKALGTSWGITGTSLLGRQDQVESFVISVVDKGGKAYTICKFSGEGSVQTGWVGTLIGSDNMIDCSGTQERESRRFTTALAKLLDLPLGKQYLDESLAVACPHCGRQISRIVKKCLYCAGAVNQEEAQA